MNLTILLKHCQSHPTGTHPCRYPNVADFQACTGASHWSSSASSITLQAVNQMLTHHQRTAKTKNSIPSAKTCTSSNLPRWMRTRSDEAERYTPKTVCPRSLSATLISPGTSKRTRASCTTSGPPAFLTWTYCAGSRFRAGRADSTARKTGFCGTGRVA